MDIEKLKKYIPVIEAISGISKDTTQVGCIILGSSYEVRSVGYNGFPRKVKELPERKVRPNKYLWTEHAERNAIYNAGRLGIPLEGSVILTFKQPCIDCARAIIQVGITEVFTFKEEVRVLEKGMTDWNEHTKVIQDMFEEAGVKVFYFN